MVKGTKGEYYDEAVSILQKDLSSGFKSVCEALVEKVPTVEPLSIEEVVRCLIENPKILLEMKSAGEEYGVLKFIKANVGEVDTTF
jgi:hypothetical protein